MAREPFTGLYSAKIRDVLLHLPECELRVFLALVSYADNTGISYPGLRTISNDTGYRIEEIQTAIRNLIRIKLVALIRHNARDSITGQRLADVLGFSPYVLVISNESLIQNHEKNWIKSFSQYNQIHLTNNKTRVKTSVSNQIPGTGIDSRASLAHGKKDTESFDPDAADETQDSDSLYSTTGQRSDSSAEQRQQYSGSSPTPPTPPPHATVAARMKAAAPALSMANIEQLLSHHGAEAAIHALDLLAADPSVRKPEAWLRKMIPRLSSSRQSRRYTSGKFSDFVES